MGAIQAPGGLSHRVNLTDLIPLDEWEVDCAAVSALRDHRIAFAVGGGLAFSTYSGRPRNTKDIDLFILPKDRVAAIRAITQAGFGDYYQEKEYDRSWIYRGYQSGVIVDLIWTMPNHRMEVDDDWLYRGPEVEVHGESVRLLPPEEMIWSKLFVMQRDRTDWPDLLNTLHVSGDRIDWDRLLGRLGDDAPVLGGLLSVFRWLCPGRARRFPAMVWERVGLLEPEPWTDGCDDGRRAHLLDTRDWFGPSHTEVSI